METQPPEPHYDEGPPKSLQAALLDISQLKLGLTKAQNDLKEEIAQVAKLSEDYATLERQHQSVVADRRALEDQNKHGQASYDKLSKSHNELSLEHSKASAELKTERQANNELRQLLMQSQLDYARICGYVDGMLDARPKRMVEADDKTGLDRIKDNAWGPSQSFRHSDGSKAWYQK